MKLKAKAYHLGEHISIAEAIEVLDFQLSREENEFALFELNEFSWVYIKDYGGLVFINVPEKLRMKTLTKLLSEKLVIENLPMESFEIIVDNSKPIRADYGLIQIPEISLDVAHVIALHMAQSVALEDFQNQVEKLLSITQNLSSDLDERGVIQSSRKKIRQVIGSTMNLKNKIALNLFIFETPTLAWSDEKLMRLDEQMRKDLEIAKRHQGLQFHLEIVKENLDMYQNILQHRHSSTLEWIIILLIFIEILHVIF